MLQKNWKSLIQPTKNVQVSESNPNVATLVIEPLERGFGMTLGNGAASHPAVFAAGRCRDFDPDRGRSA